MKFNILYIFWFFLLIVAGLLINSFVNTSQTTVFGTADTEGQILNFESPVIIKKILIRTGSQVKKGDTLMLLQRPELDRETTLKTREIQVASAEKYARVQDIDREIEKLRSDYTIKTNDIRSQIQLLEVEEKTQAALRKVVDNSKTDNGKSLIVEKINALKNANRVEEQRFNAQLRELNQAKTAQTSVFDTKENTTSQEMSFLEEAKDRLILLSPIDGYVENVLVFENQITPQYSQLLKLNPQKPNKIRGFLPEAVDITYRLGDTVDVYAARRPNVKSKAILIGSNPQLIELPTRLRKFQTISTWGRELYISLPANNDFFIGEKIIIKMKGH
jgi:multidrug efflux pump subunit AcrA (membrane-fusion protein)